jgi:hypothetical protein
VAALSGLGELWTQRPFPAASIKATGEVPSYASSTLWHVRGNLCFATFNHE